MAMIWANEGADALTQIMINRLAFDPTFTLRLFSNNRTPQNTDDYASIAAQTTELTATGYAAIALTPGSWTVSGGYPTTGLGQYVYPQQTFSFTGAGAQTVYGYFLTMVINATNYKWGAELLGTPYTIPGGGGSLLITPTFQEGQR